MSPYDSRQIEKEPKVNNNLKETNKMKAYLINNIAILSHILNTVTGGSRFYTFSARTHYCAHHLDNDHWKFVEKCIDTLFFLQKNHCRKEYYNELRKRTPVKVKS